MRRGTIMSGENSSTSLKTTVLTAADLERIRELKRATEKEKQISLMLYSRDGIQVIPLVEGVCVVIGRSPPADVAIRDNSLSRLHVCVELLQGEVWVNDLESTNGTWVNGAQVERAKVDLGVELMFGAVLATIQKAAPLETRSLGVANHDDFLASVSAEINRAKMYSRSLSLVMFSSGKKEAPHVSRWFPEVQTFLRPFDRVAFYSANTVEILLPELDEGQAKKIAAEILAQTPYLLGAIAVFPVHAVSAEALLEATRTAMGRTHSAPPLQIAEAAFTSVSTSDKGLEVSQSAVIQSAAMREIFKTIHKVASSSIPVLVNGETGTGKEVVARAIHANGNRKNKPIRCVNCGAIPSQLVESTLFGHERGAFTGATSQVKGVFESAEGGTVLLDEIGELPPSAQASLLRVLDTKRISRVGSTKEIEVDARVIAATHKNLEAMVQRGEFREDLLYRLNTMTLRVPPLRERIEEIEPLARHFMQRANEANQSQVDSIDEDALQHLLQYSWPGNVRELRNAIERAVVIAQDNVITLEDLPERVREMGCVARSRDGDEKVEPAFPKEGQDCVNLRAEVQRFESELILRALKVASWDRNLAARNLGVPLRTLSRKMQQYGIRKVSYQQT